MDNKVLLERSPIRYLEKTTKGGLHSGEMGIITSAKGMGKTAILVQLGLDALLNNKKIVHISFNQTKDTASTWFDDIFHELTKIFNKTEVSELKEQLFKNRILLNFNQDVISINAVIQTLKALETSGIKIDYLLFDDLNFEKTELSEINELMDFAKESEVAVWIGTSIENPESGKKFTDEISEKMALHLNLEQENDGIKIRVLKSNNQEVPESNLSIDSKTLLIAGNK